MHTKLKSYKKTFWVSEGKESKHQRQGATRKAKTQEKLKENRGKIIVVKTLVLYPTPFSGHVAQGKSSSITFVQVKYPKPTDGAAALPLPDVEGTTKLLRSSSRKLRVRGFTASLARFLSSSTLLSNRLRLSREYISGVSLRKRLHSS